MFEFKPLARVVYCVVCRSSPAYEINENQINKLAIEVQELDDTVEKLREKIANPSKIKLAKEQFLNLVKLAPDKMRAGSVVEKDRVSRILFLNLTLDNKKKARRHLGRAFCEPG